MVYINLSKWGCGAAGSASEWHSEGRGFDPLQLHFFLHIELKKMHLSIKKIICVFVLLVLFAIIPILVQGQKSVLDLKRVVVRIGKLKFKKDVSIKYLNRSQLTSYIEDEIDKEYPEELSEKENLYAELMGFVEKKVDMRKFKKNIVLSNVGGMYNEKTKELYAIDEYRNIDMMNSLIIVHELRHSIQDQYFDLSGILGDFSDFDDRKLAVLSAIEGDATFVMVKFSGLSPEVLASTYNAEALMSFSPIGNLDSLYNAPGIVKYQVIMPYVDGLKFVHTVFKKKKWKGVNRILSSPPCSSEQILHPEKYLKNEKPIEVDIGYVPDGYELYHSGVIGEFYLNVLLSPPQRYFDMAAGWGGDWFEIYKNPRFFFFLWESVWDKDKYCTSFFSVFRGFLEKKFKVKFRAGSVKGNHFMGGDSDHGYFFIRMIKNKIFYVRSNDRDQINKFINGGYYD